MARAPSLPNLNKLTERIRAARERAAEMAEPTRAAGEKARERLSADPETDPQTKALLGCVGPPKAYPEDRAVRARQRRSDVERLTAHAVPVQLIALFTGVSERHVSRLRRKLGVSKTKLQR